MRDRVVLSSDDSEAALQILAHLAYPHRPHYGLEIAASYAGHYRGVTNGLEKWSRLEPKVRRFDDMVVRCLRISYWHRLKCNRDFRTKNHLQHWPEGMPIHEASLLASARSFSPDQSDQKTLERNWPAYRPVAHLGLAVGDAILMSHSAEADRRWSLREIAFRPKWVERAILHAELNAKSGAEFGFIPIEAALHFTR